MGLTPGIARYLLALDDALDASPADRSRTLAEVEEHLADAVDEQLALGVDLAAAEASAIARFGSPVDVAAAFHDGAGVRAAPYTLRRLFDAWRTDHIWLGALVPTALMAGLIALFLVAFAVIAKVPIGDQTTIVRIATNPFFVFVSAAFFIGRVVMGYAVRRRPEPLFHSRVGSFKRDRPLAHSALVQLPPALGLAAAGMALRQSIAFVLALFAMQLAPLAYTGRGCVSSRAWVPRVVARLRQGFPLLVLPLVGLTSGGARDARHVAAWTLPAVVMFAGLLLIPRFWRDRLSIWPIAAVMFVGLSMQAALLGYSVRGFAALVGFVTTFGVVMSLMMRRIAALPNRSRLRAAEAGADTS